MPNCQVQGHVAGVAWGAGAGPLGDGLLGPGFGVADGASVIGGELGALGVS